MSRTVTLQSSHEYYIHTLILHRVHSIKRIYRTFSKIILRISIVFCFEKKTTDKYREKIKKKKTQRIKRERKNIKNDIKIG